MELDRQGEAAKVTVARYLVRVGPTFRPAHGPPAPRPDRHAAGGETRVSEAATNLNQLARVANSTGRVRAEVLEAAERMAQAVDELEDENEYEHADQRVIAAPPGSTSLSVGP